MFLNLMFLNLMFLNLMFLNLMFLNLIFLNLEMGSKNWRIKIIIANLAANFFITHSSFPFFIITD
jgi:hypothetical protein